MIVMDCSLNRIGKCTVPNGTSITDIKICGSEILNDESLGGLCHSLLECLLLGLF